MIKKTFLLGFTLSLLSFGSVDPLGQSADYALDKNPLRTSSMIMSGTVKAAVVAYLESTLVGPAYEVNLNYKFNVSLFGTQVGSEKTVLEKEFFTEEFMQKLRKEKHYEGAYFKADHLGFADAKNLDGKFYPHCDKVLLYDIKKPPQFMREVLASVLDVPPGNIQDLKVLAHAYKGIPVMGGAKIDLSGKYNGMPVKLGVDYVSP